jgi:hypothetical protein
MNRPTYLSHLTPARQQLVRYCQALNYGTIRAIEVRSGDPVLSPSPTVVYDWRLDTDERPRPETASLDFELRHEVQRMVDKLDQIGNGWIEQIEVRAGLPRRMTIEVALQEVAR